MNKSKFQSLTLITDEILNCNICKFHQELASKNLPFRPEAPLRCLEKNQDYKVIVVGINPGWRDEEYVKWKEIYSEKNLEEYKKKYKEEIKEWDKNNNDLYKQSLIYTFKIINEQLGIYNYEINNGNIYDYIFWANLSFCNSNNVNERIINGQKIHCDIYDEEIPNCLKKGYLKRIIETIEPELIIFLGKEAQNLGYFVKIFGNMNYTLFDFYYKTQFPAHKSSGKTKNFKILAGILKKNGRKLYILFLPHPQYQITLQNKEESLIEICNWLKDANL